MELSKIAKRAVATHPGATALEASEQMVSEKIGAMVVLDAGRLVGILSERDIVGRLVARRLDPDKTLVSEIMTTRVQTITVGTSDVQALELMHQGRFRHLPLVDGDGQVIGMLSMRHLMSERMGELALKNADLVNFISTDGAGGD